MSAAPAAAARPPGIVARLHQRAFRVAPADHDLVVLRHSRIYILPTRRGVALMLTLVLMLLTSLNYALSLGLAVTFLLAGLAAAALLHTFRNLAGMEVKPLAAGDTFAGGRMAFSLALVPGTATRLAVVLSARGVRMMADVPAGEVRTVSLEVPTTTRGRIPLGRVTLSSSYPLGLWKAWAYVHFPLYGIAFPAPEASAPPLPLGPGGNDARTQGKGEDADLAGLRDYQRGDPPQRVAWKAVARGAGWYSKAFEGSGGGPVVLDWRALPADLDVEARLSRLSAWVLGAERAARPFALSLPGLVMPPSQGREHRRAALTALAVFPGESA
jgi:uncharacterized protein (DUF58 family)